ncbi:hypothetical protein JEG43_13180 [Anoxybacillus sp. LAT_35]|uniref:hypothetical protein n=1 Tax=unclassified Anoxybacillus TaxID=2639704 RepID=UPI001EEA1807|nr:MULTISPECIES: hypothetical protein [unclassified Anoxybacillus]MCG6172592.1 hypothetical protein [Anoxybacillus sp. LAT_11]MCG6178957.1 hypothetical protein [Anoxybacillus sp. LAT_35]MCG6184548.1 hypothetical protein [Anoxybacillus sp. LAT_26]MCG6199261.1 hypothetical protein [Anoxybacillus sp. LAT_38]
MLKQLPHRMKMNITLSIKKVFERYMATIGWDETKYDAATFMEQWRHYLYNEATWFNELDDTMKANPHFHEQLAERINEIIDQLVNEPPTDDQIAEINRLVERLGIDDFPYGCRLEAKYHIERLQQELKKKKS